MRLVALFFLVLVGFPAVARAGSNGQSLGGNGGRTITVSAEAQVAHRQAEVVARVRDPLPRDATSGGRQVNGQQTKPVGAEHVCDAAKEIGADYSNSEDTEVVIDTDPITKVQTSREVVVRRWILVIVNCGGTQYIQRRCTFGDCPTGSQFGFDTLPDIEKLIDEARDSANYEVPEPLFSPAVKPGKAPIPGIPLFFAVSGYQWNRAISSHATACNGVRCAEAHVVARVVGLRFTPGDGRPVVLCETAGITVRTSAEYRSASRRCSYTYSRAGDHKGSMALLYDATVWGGEVGQTSSFGPRIERVVIDADLLIPVSEYQPVIVG